MLNVAVMCLDVGDGVIYYPSFLDGTADDSVFYSWKQCGSGDTMQRVPQVCHLYLREGSASAFLLPTVGPEAGISCFFFPLCFSGGVYVMLLLKFIRRVRDHR